MTIIRLFLARIIGGLVAALAGWLAVRYGIVLDDTVQAELVSNVVAVMLVFFSILYPVIHKLMDGKWFNKGDAASVRLAEEENKRVEVIRANDG